MLQGHRSKNIQKSMIMIDVITMMTLIKVYLLAMIMKEAIATTTMVNVNLKITIITQGHDSKDIGQRVHVFISR